MKLKAKLLKSIKLIRNESVCSVDEYNRLLTQQARDEKLIEDYKEAKFTDSARINELTVEVRKLRESSKNKWRQIAINDTKKWMELEGKLKESEKENEELKQWIDHHPAEPKIKEE
jgi:hypothetical protein